MPMDGRKQEDTASGTGWSADTERSADSNSADDENAADEGGGLALHISMAALSAMRLRGGLATREPMLPSRFPGRLRSGVIKRVRFELVSLSDSNFDLLRVSDSSKVRVSD